MQCAHGEKIPRGHTTTPSTTERTPALHTIHSGATALGKAAASAATTRTRPQASDRGQSRPRRQWLCRPRSHPPASEGGRTPDSGRARPGRAANRLRGRPIPAAAVYQFHAPGWVSSCGHARPTVGGQEGLIGPLAGVIRPLSPIPPSAGRPAGQRDRWPPHAGPSALSPPRLIGSNPGRAGQPARIFSSVEHRCSATSSTSPRSPAWRRSSP